MQLSIHICLAVFIAIASLTTARAQMMQCLPGQKCDPIPVDELLTQEDYVQSILKHWSPSQVQAWKTLDPLFQNWVTRLMWNEQQKKEIEARLGHKINTRFDPYFRLYNPPNCQLSAWVGPKRPFITAYMNELRVTVPNAGWDSWANIEPVFRTRAELAMSENRFMQIKLRATADWWERNAAAIAACIESARKHALTAVQVNAYQLSQNQYNSAIDREYQQEKERVRDQFGPAELRKQKMEELDTYKEIDKFEHDADRSHDADKPQKAADPHPSPSPQADHVH